EEPDAALLIERQAGELKPPNCDLEDPLRNVDPDDFLEAAVVDQQPQQAPFAATEIEDATSPKLLQRRQDGCEALPVQPDPLLDLVVTDPVVLLVVEHGDQHIEMRQQVAQPASAPQSHAEVVALPPTRERLVQRQTRRFDLIAKRSEQPLEQTVTASRGNHRDP